MPNTENKTIDLQQEIVKSLLQNDFQKCTKNDPLWIGTLTNVERL